MDGHKERHTDPEREDGINPCSLWAKDSKEQDGMRNKTRWNNKEMERK